MTPNATTITVDPLHVAPLFTAPHAANQAATLLQTWVSNFLCQPHADLGREGPVCPLTRPSLEKDLFWACYDERASLDIDDICAQVRYARDQFQDLPPTTGPDALLKAVLIVFPNLTHYDTIDAAQQHLKSEFVNDGLMLGQFYPGCAERGLWNPHFRPLHAPLPLLAIRHMVSNDFPFLDSRPDWIHAYLRKFAPSVPAPIRARLARHAADPA